MPTCRSLTAILVLFTSSAAADDNPNETHDTQAALAQYEEAVRNAADEYVRIVRQARTTYVESLDAAMREATRAGDLDLALELREQKQGLERELSVIPNPLAPLPAAERAAENLRLEPTPAIPLSNESLTARPWYVFHRTSQASPEIVIELQPDGSMQVLEGADSTSWDEEQATWRIEGGHLVLTGRRGILAHFEATNIVLIRSREEVPHRFFWVQQQIPDPFLAPAAANRR